MECQCKLAIRKVSVHLSNTCTVTKMEERSSRFLYIQKIILHSCLRRRMVGWGDPFLRENLADTDPPTDF